MNRKRSLVSTLALAAAAMMPGPSFKAAEVIALKAEPGDSHSFLGLKRTRASEYRAGTNQRKRRKLARNMGIHPANARR